MGQSTLSVEPTAQDPDAYFKSAYAKLHAVNSEARRKSEAAGAVGERELVRIHPSDPSVEAMYQATLGAGARVVAVIDVRAGAGASVCAQALAERSRLAARRTLLVDATCDGLEVTKLLASTPEALHRLSLRSSDGDFYRYRSPQTLRHLWDEDYGRFRAIIIDCNPALAAGPLEIPGALAARSADATLLVSMGGRETRETVCAAVAALGEARLAGVVVNGRDQPTVGAEIAREARRLERRMPWLARALMARALTSKFLDVPS